MSLTTLISAVVLSALVGQVATNAATADAEADVLQYVDQLIGSSNGGSLCITPGR
jgi:hypothetical protein